MPAKCDYAPDVTCAVCGAEAGWCNPECENCLLGCEAQPKHPCEWD